eukprot:3269148-Pleurochrysis_carterae.AAC.1
MLTWCRRRVSRGTRRLLSLASVAAMLVHSAARRGPRRRVRSSSVLRVCGGKLPGDVLCCGRHVRRRKAQVASGLRAVGCAAAVTRRRRGRRRPGIATRRRGVLVWAQP